MGCMGQKAFDLSSKQRLQRNKEGHTILKLSSFSSNTSHMYVEAADGSIDQGYEKSQEDRDEIVEALNGHFIFTSLTDDDKDVVSLSMNLYRFPAKSLVFEEGRPSRNYYVVRSGSLEVLRGSRRVHRIAKGEGFGELALLREEIRPASVRCLEPTELWGIDKFTFRKVIEDLNTQIYEQNRDFLERVPLLQSLTSSQKDALAASLAVNKYYAGQMIIVEGQTGSQLFIVKSGSVLVQQEGKEIRRLKAGDYFGEIALLYNAPRSATCSAVDGPVQCLTLSRDTLQKNLGNQLQNIIERNTILEAINKSNTLSKLSVEQKESIIKNLNLRSYKAGDVVIPAGKSCSLKLYIIIEGKLQYAHTPGRYIEKAEGIGDGFLTSSAKEESKFEDDVIAAEETKVGELTKYQFELSIGGKFDAVIQENAATNVLKKVYLFNSLQTSKFKELFSMIQEAKFADGELVLQEGQMNDCIYIIKRGTITVLKGKDLVQTVTKHDYFGEHAILLGSPAKFTYRAMGSAVLWIIYNRDFECLLNEEMKDQLARRIEMQEEDCKLNELIPIKLLGRGGFSKVFLVKTTFSNKLYALKCISKARIRQFALQERFLLEKHILLMIDHPFIVKLAKTFNDFKRIYFLLEYVHGLDLSTIIQLRKNLSNSDAQFYCASLVLVLQYLHERDIVYRDLSPDNVMIDIDGFIKLIDFGNAKPIQGRTYTIVGTPHYMAPEILTGKGYSKSTDLWSLGICMYEFFTGKVPFGEDEEDTYKIYEKVIDMDLVFDRENGFPTESAIGLIMQLLSKNPLLRSENSVSSLKKHEWFVGFDWEALVCRKSIPPYAPDIPNIDEEIDEELEPTSPWDLAISQHSNVEEDSPMYSLDTELEEFKNSIPEDWGNAF